MASLSQPAVFAKPANLTEWRGTGGLIRLILVLALPVTVTNALQAMLQFVDIKMVSDLGKEALASMSVGRPAFMLSTSVFMGLGAGIMAYVARLSGAGDHARAKAYAGIGILTATVLGLLITLGGWLLGPAPIRYLITSAADGATVASVELARRYAWDFISVLLLGMAAMGIQFAAVSIFNSLGRTLFPMWLLVISNVANFIGNWFLIQRMEVAGCALSTTLTFVVTSFVTVYWLTRHGMVVWDRSLLYQPILRAWEMLKLGSPIILQVALRAFASVVILKLITYLPNSIVGQSALLVGLQAEALAFMPAFAFSTAAATLVGQNLGARKPGQARVSANYCIRFSELILATMGILFYFFPHWFIQLFIGNSSPETTREAAQYLQIIAFCLPGLGIGMTLNGALRGAGDTKAAAWITIAAQWLVRIPLVTLLALHNIGGTGLGFGFGLPGIWWGMTSSVYVEALLCTLRFNGGYWSRIKLHTV